MDFDIEKFVDRLRKEAPTKQEAARIIYEEIRAAENQKVGFLDQATENPDFYKHVSSQSDSYMAYLKVMHNKFAPEGYQEVDERVYKLDKAIIDRTMELVKQLEQVEHGRKATLEGEQRKTNLYTTDEDL